MRNWQSETGTALVVSLMAVLLLSALGAALVMTTNTEVMLTKNFESAQQALYGADAGIERGLQELIREPNWNVVLTGGATSSFIDDPPYRLPDGTSADLTAMTNALQSDTDTLYG